MVWVLAAVVLSGFGLTGAYAQTGADAEAQQLQEEAPAPGQAADDSLRLQAQADAVVLSAQVRFPLPPLVEDALSKGIPVHFVQQAKLSAERWYWSDKVIADVERHLRLSYQPLTRRWRLHVSSEPWSERKTTGIALGVSYDSLEDALSAMQRIVHWRIAEKTQLPANGVLTLEVTMGIDAAQLPRPLQIGNLGRTRWSVLAVRTSKVDVQAMR